MKPFSIFCLLIWLCVGNETQAASYSDSILPGQTAVMPADSLVQQKTMKPKNIASVVSLVSGILGVLNFILGLAFYVGFPIFLGVILALLALITGIVGLKKRKKRLRIAYHQSTNAQALPLGKGRSIAGIILGGLVSGFVAIMIGLAITRSRPKGM